EVRVMFQNVRVKLNTENQYVHDRLISLFDREEVNSMFYFQNSDDMELFLEELHTKKGLVVHCSTSIAYNDPMDELTNKTLSHGDQDLFPVQKILNEPNGNSFIVLAYIFEFRKSVLT
ncbi:unnamed protein product, partial [Didymodactylos carnosus]